MCRQWGRSIATVAFEYLCVTKREVYTTEELNDHALREEFEESSLKVLVVRNLKSKAVFAHAVVAKGVDEKGFMVDSVLKDIAWMADSRRILKSDKEPVVVKVLWESLKALKVEGLDQASEEHPPLESRNPMAALW